MHVVSTFYKQIYKNKNSTSVCVNQHTPKKKKKWQGNKFSHGIKKKGPSKIFVSHKIHSTTIMKQAWICQPNELPSLLHKNPTSQLLISMLTVVKGVLQTSFVKHWLRLLF